MKKTTKLRNLITSNQLETIMEAHNALSAKIVEEVGFKGIWASGLSISAALGVRDNNEASWTQVLEVLEFMSDATSIPILLDGDTGYGNFNNARRLVKKLEQRQVAGVCIEDKLFPKTNSFIRGEAQPLADIDEFCGKIKAMKDSQIDEDFVVISRVEAFIAGWGLREAIKRAEAYCKAGTDGILIHSKRSDIAEIEAFMKEWGDRLPVVIVPTKYYSVPSDKFKDLGISLAIWANHNLRAAIKAMKQTSSQILKDESLRNVEKNVSSLEEVFRLQGARELEEAEKIYFPSKEQKMNSIILVRNSEALPLIEEQVNGLNAFGIKDIVKIGKTGESEEICDRTTDGGDLSLLYHAKDKISENSIISYGEMVYKTHLLDELINDGNGITILVDADYEVDGKGKLFVKGEMQYSKKLFSKTVDMVQMTSEYTGEVHGEFIGLWKVSKKGSLIVREALEKLYEKGDFNQLTFADLFNHIKSTYPVAIKYIKGSWIDLEVFNVIQKTGEKND